MLRELGVIGYGIIGCGWVAPSHAAAVAALSGDNVRLVAVADADLPRAERLAADFRVPHVYTDYQELLDRPDVQIVSICLPDFLHSASAIAAARAGKHVLCEKPLALSAEAALEMVREFEARRLNLGMVLNHRYSRENMIVKRAMEQGAIGKTVLGSVVHSSALTGNEDGQSPWRGKHNLAAGGVIASQAIHFIDQLLWFMGPAVSVKGLVSNVKGVSESEDVAAIALRLADEALATVATTNASPIYSDLEGTQLELYGTRGRIVLSRGKVTAFESDVLHSLPEIEQEELEGVEPGVFGRGHYFAVADFVESVRRGEPPPVSGRDGAHLNAVVDAVYKSAASGLEERVIDVPEAYRTARVHI